MELEVNVDTTEKACVNSDSVQNESNGNNITSEEGIQSTNELEGEESDTRLSQPSGADIQVENGPNNELELEAGDQMESSCPEPGTDDVEDDHPESPLMPCIVSSVSFGSPFQLLGDRKIQTAVHRGNRGSTSTETEVESSSERNRCLNLTCEGLTTDSELLKAPAHAVLYFGFGGSGDRKSLSKGFKICASCLDKANRFQEDTRAAWDSETPVIAVPLCEQESGMTEHSDSEPEPDEIEEIELEDDELPEEVGVDQVLEQMLTGLRMKNQVNSCVDYLNEEVAALETGYEELDVMFEDISASVEATRVALNEFVGPQYNSVVLKSVDVDSSTGRVSTINSTDELTKEFLTAHERLKSEAGKTQIKEEVMITEDVLKTQNHRDSASTNSDVEAVAVKLSKPKMTLASTPAVIPRVMPKVGDSVYGMKHSALSYWIPGRIMEVARSLLDSQLEYKVQFEIARKGRSSHSSGRDLTYQTKAMSAKHLAYNLPCPFILPVGSRVIARFRDEFKTEPLGANNFYVGIVAEPPKNTNDYRYLVFFDDGYAQYSVPEEVLLVCETSKDVWYDVHPDSQEFIKNYILKYPERPMVRLQKGTLMSTEWNGNWWIARVIEVDCSLVKVYFEEDCRYEWIYRGSTRLAPLYTKAKKLEGVSASNVPRRQNRTFNPKSNAQAVIEYQYEETPVAAQISRAGTARKSTSQPPASAGSDDGAKARKVVKHQGPRGLSDLVEYEGTTTKVLLQDVRGPIPFKPHECNSTCVRPFKENDPEVKLINPLSLPLYFGWAREIGKTPRRTIFYRTPCGRRLRNYEDLHRYLKDTEYNMGIDNFCFDFAVDCLSEFAPTRHHYMLQDISYGKEVMPVQCVNSVDHDYPEHVHYVMNRRIGDNVPILLDPGFLTCCDCEDDCSDKDKCACWQLTIEGTNLGKDTINLEVGYQNRRLMDHVVSGIYECNKGCKCRSTCSNRVVQNNLRWRLQIFKTATKGWAIRPLHDIPQGAFICVYAGQLLTDHGADKDGKAHGDEYLAELDYIEVIESVKAGYEAEAIEDDVARRVALQKALKHRYKAYMEETSTETSSGEIDIGQSRSGPRSKEPVGGSAGPSDNPLETDSEDEDEAPSSTKPSMRSLFGPNEMCYIMDAKGHGNVGRYLNHSCSPNVFVQNVFVDSHDIRFPWVAFFAYKHIRAGTELTWDYNYDVGSVPGKVMYCHCNSPDCRGRLL